MHSIGGKKSGSSEARPSRGHESDPSTIDTPTTDLLPLLSEAHTARAELEFEDVPEVVAEVPASPLQAFLGTQPESDDTLTDALEIPEWPADPLLPLPILYEGAPDVVEIYEDDLPELVSRDPGVFTATSSPPVNVEYLPPPSIEVASLWLDMVEEMVELIGEMEEDAGQLRLDQPDSAETCRHVALRLTLMLARNGVTVIGIKEQGAVESIMGQTFDRARHQPITRDIPTRGTCIIEVISPGFAVGQRILRRARVYCQ